MRTKLHTTFRVGSGRTALTRPSHRSVVGPLALAAALVIAASHACVAAYVKGWEDLGGHVKDVALSSPSPSRLDVWAIGSDGAVWHATLIDGVGTGWEGSPGKPSGRTLTAIAAVHRGNGRTEILATDSTKEVWSRTWSDSTYKWTAWQRVATAEAVGKPALSAVPSQDRVDAWVLGASGKLWHSWRVKDQAWSRWVNEGGPPGGFASGPSVVTRQESPLIIDVAVVARTGGIWQGRWENGRWQAWQSVASSVFFDPAVAPALSRKGPTELVIVARGDGSDSTLYQAGWTKASGWSNFVSVAPPEYGTLTDVPTALVVDGRLEVAVRGEGGNVWRKSPLENIAQAQAIIGLVGKCIDTDTVTLSAHGHPRAVIQTCTGHSSQSWIQEGRRLRNRFSDLCLNVEGGFTANGSAVIAYPCAATPQPNEMWDAIPSGAGIQLRSAQSSKCLAVKNAHRADRTGLVVQACVGQPSDRWHLGDGTAERIRVRAYVLSNDDGGDAPTTTLAQFRATLDAANNAVLLRAGLRLEIANGDWIPVRSSLINSIGVEANVQGLESRPADDAARQLAASSPGYFTVLITNSYPGGFSGHSSASDFLVWNGGGLDTATAVHEVGHYFDLDHTMWDHLYRSCQPYYPQPSSPAGYTDDCWGAAFWDAYYDSPAPRDAERIFDADMVDDTPADPGPWVFQRRGSKMPAGLPGQSDECAGSDRIEMTDQYIIPWGLVQHPAVVLQPDRHNAMSYFKGCWQAEPWKLSLSPGQIAKMQQALHGEYRRHLLERIQ